MTRIIVDVFSRDLKSLNFLVNRLLCAKKFHKKVPKCISRLRDKRKSFPDCPETFQILRKLSKSPKNFPDYPACFQMSKNFPDCPEPFQTFSRCFILSQFFIYAQKLSGWQCRRANVFFVSLKAKLVTLLEKRQM